jgi:hypothetical protein
MRPGDKLPSGTFRAEALAGIVVVKCSEEGCVYPISSTAPRCVTTKATIDQEAEVTIP